MFIILWVIVNDLYEYWNDNYDTNDKIQKIQIKKYNLKNSIVKIEELFSTLHAGIFSRKKLARLFLGAQPLGL
jgi:hypothetical protein